jgi:hypothetical protein
LASGDHSERFIQAKVRARMEEDPLIRGAKTLSIRAVARYPIVSAWEFESLKAEEGVQALLKPCTVYFILQRPLMFFNVLETHSDELVFEIVDVATTQPLLCRMNPKANNFGPPGEDLFINLQYHKPEPDKAPPFRDVAAFKLLDLRERFLHWLTPQKFLFEYVGGHLKAEVKGDLANFINYKIHYIGQSFSQAVWDRLTGHHKMQSILTLEDALNPKSTKPALEINLAMLDIIGFDEAYMVPYLDLGIPNPILHKLDPDDEEAWDKFFEPFLDPKARELTNEVEAMLVQRFKPQYNEVQFDNYPNIKSGVRSVGYSHADLVIESLPALLYTDHFTQPPIGTHEGK